MEQEATENEMRKMPCRHCHWEPVSRSWPFLLAATAHLLAGWPGKATITSGARCPEHNRAVGGAADSLHLYGAAVDVVVDRDSRASLIGHAIVAGFRDGAVYDDKPHVHLEIERR